jgi:hypothetical protein
MGNVCFGGGVVGFTGDPDGVMCDGG